MSTTNESQCRVIGEGSTVGRSQSTPNKHPLLYIFFHLFSDENFKIRSFASLPL